MSFPVRKPQISLDDQKEIPIDWYDNNVVLSALWDALSLTFPEGETFFVRSVRHFLGYAAYNPKIHGEVKSFIGQEAVHGKEHRVYNKIVDPTGVVEEEVKWILEQAYGLSPEMKLAITCALEHFTAILAEEIVFKYPDKIQHPELKKMWCWHAVEESEHKHVAFDLYEKVSGSYILRVSTYAATMLILGAVIVRFHNYVLSKRNVVKNAEGWKKTFKFLFSNEKIFWKTLPKFLAYYSPGFHPNKISHEFIEHTRTHILKSVGLV